MPNHNDTPISLKKEIACVQQTIQFSAGLIYASPAGAVQAAAWARVPGRPARPHCCMGLETLPLLQVGSQEVSAWCGGLKDPAGWAEGAWLGGTVVCGARRAVHKHLGGR